MKAKDNVQVIKVTGEPTGGTLTFTWLGKPSGTLPHDVSATRIEFEVNSLHIRAARRVRREKAWRWIRKALVVLAAVAVSGLVLEIARRFWWAA